MNETTVHRTVKEIVAPYELKVPDEFNVKPTYTVALPKGYQALVFASEVKEWDRNGNKYDKVPGWRIVILRKDGVKASGRNRGDLHADYTLIDPLNVKMFLQDWAVHLSAKKTVETVDEE